MPIPLLVRKTVASDEAAIAQVLIRAFDDDPLVNWIVNPGARRQERVRILIMAARHSTYPHFFLYMLAVDPDHQGRGISTALTQPVLTRCDQEGRPASLENSKERNIALYERNGFRVVEAFIPPKNGHPLWLMLREPKQ